MTTTRFVPREIGRLALLATLLPLFASLVYAQEPAPTRPFRGLFGGSDPNRRSVVELSWTATGAYDDDITGEAQRSFDTRLPVRGSYGAGGASLRYDVRGRHATFAANGGAAGRYSSEGGFGDMNATADATFTLTSGQHTSISAFQGFRHQPYYQLNILTNAAPTAPSTAPAATPAAPTRDGALTSIGSNEYDGRVRLVERFGTRSSLTAGYAYRHSRITGLPDASRWQFGNVSFSQELTRYLALRLGYGYGDEHDGVRPESTPVVTQNIDIGVDYARPISQSRRTTIGFSSGSTIIEYEGVRYYRLLADASLAREIGRTWNARVDYHRGGQFVEGISSPLYVDSIQTRATGQISRRVDMILTGGYSNGQIGLSATDRGYTMYSGTADIGVALVRTLSLRAQYFHYHYEFGGIALPFGLPSRINRQGVRLGLFGWLPLVR